MKQFIFLLVFSCKIAYSQEVDTKKVDSGIKYGIQFVDSYSWNAVKEAAKRDKKYIFIDCYTTWCGPCKMMEKEIFVNEKIAKYYNGTFINLRLQFDTSKSDNEKIKMNYSFADSLMRGLKIRSFPTFLFFSPDGVIVHREEGLKNAQDFLTVGKDAVDKNKQFYTNLRLYKEKGLRIDLYYELAQNVKRLLKDNNLANEIGKLYLSNYLYKMKGSELLGNPQYIEAIAIYLQNTSEFGFEFFRKFNAEIDKAIRPGYANEVIDYTVYKQFINPVIKTNDSPVKNMPNWNSLKRKLTFEFDSIISDRVILTAKIFWSTSVNDWRLQAESNLEKVEKYGYDTSLLGRIILNNMIWQVIVKHTDDAHMINRALKIMYSLVEKDSIPSFCDTYANLLYKTGRKKEAIIWQEKAVVFESQNALNVKAVPSISYTETLVKMKSNELSW